MIRRRLSLLRVAIAAFVVSGGGGGGASPSGYGNDYGNNYGAS